MGKYVYQAVLFPEEEGGYSVSFPDLPGCFSCGDDYMDAVAMGADAAKTYIGSLLLHGEAVPSPTRHETPAEGESIHVFFETDPDYIVQSEVVSAAEASRELGVTPGRVSHMLSSGILEGYRTGRRTWITKDSIAARKAEKPKAGRPKGSGKQAADMASVG